MIYRTLAASVLALGLLSPAAFAANPECDQVNNRIADYGTKCDFNDAVLDATASTGGNALAASSDIVTVGPVGDYVDETPSESNQRSQRR